MSDPSRDFALRSRRIVTEAGVVEGAVVVREGIIDSIVSPDGVPAGIRLVDADESVVMPGLVDTHVHINEPGRTQWEGFETATRAAAAGGVTTMVEMPLNSIPPTTSRAALDAKVRAAEGKLFVDCGFHGGVVPGNGAEIPGLVEAGVFGLKAFLIDSGVPEFPAVGEADLRASMSLIAKAKIPLLVHAELASSPAPASGSAVSYAAYLASRPRHWENEAIDLVLNLGLEYGCRVHIVHLSCSDAVSPLTRARENGQPVTVETCPHYLFFASEEIEDGNTLLKCAPPIRESENRDRLWEALDAGVIDFVVSDHSPAPSDMKCLSSGDFFQAWGGIASLQLGLSAMWTLSRTLGFTVEDLTRWMCAGPAKLVGLFGRKGVLRAGADADMIVFDPDASRKVDRKNMLHRHRLTPYEGRVLSGVVEKTFLRGDLVFSDGAVGGSPLGCILRRGET